MINVTLGTGLVFFGVACAIGTMGNAIARQPTMTNVSSEVRFVAGAGYAPCAGNGGPMVVYDRQYWQSDSDYMFILSNGDLIVNTV